MVRLCVVLNRIIPARAGFTFLNEYKAMRDQDHPRSRGVYPRFIAGSLLTCGSSPLARGLLTDCGGQWALAGIIPARAGFTRRVPHLDRPDADHPRSRGVYGLTLALAVAAGGSSPLARGLRR